MSEYTPRRLKSAKIKADQLKAERSLTAGELLPEYRLDVIGRRRIEQAAVACPVVQRQLGRERARKLLHKQESPAPKPHAPWNRRRDTLLQGYRLLLPKAIRIK